MGGETKKNAGSARTSPKRQPTKAKAKAKSKSKSAPTPEQVLENGRTELDALTETSAFFAENPPRKFPLFVRKELGLGRRLGVGAFCNVSEVVAIRLQESGDENGDGAAAEEPTEAAAEATNGRADEADDNGQARDDDEGEVHEHHYNMTPTQARTFMLDHCLRDGDARYAIKRLRPDLDDMVRAKGIVDLAMEAKYLSAIYHPNIVKMRGLAEGDPLSGGGGFFIVMDRLYDTLEERIDQWKERRKISSGCMGCFGVDKDELAVLMVERVTVAYDISSVFRYLHAKKLIYRDIKPDNIGFDVRDDVKMFDFGLCKELTPSLKVKKGGNDEYKLTGLTGSRRYMAPEVVLCKPYGFTADVFSFGILLWQLLSLEVPFEAFDPHDHREKVVKAGYRPPVHGSWPVYTRELVKECWSDKPSDRPDFSRVASVLKGDLGQMVADAGASIHNRTTHMMKRSQHSQRGYQVED